MWTMVNTAVYRSPILSTQNGLKYISSCKYSISVETRREMVLVLLRPLSWYLPLSTCVGRILPHSSQKKIGAKAPKTNQMDCGKYRNAVHFCQRKNGLKYKVVAKTALVLKHVDKWFFGTLVAVVGADCGKMRPTQVDCGRPLGSRPLWTTKTNKIHGKVGAQQYGITSVPGPSVPGLG